MKKILRVSVPLLIFFGAVYIFLPAYDANHEIVIHTTSTRLYLSIAVIGPLLFLLYVRTRVMIPIIFGITPIIYSLVNSGAVYGGGVELFYFLSILLILKKLPKQAGIRQIRVRGLMPLLLFFTVALAVRLIKQPADFTFNTFIQAGTFILVVYFFYKKIDTVLFLRVLYSILLGNVILLLWLVSKLRFPELLRDRMGGLINPGIVASYAIIAIIALCFIIIKKRLELTAYHLFFILSMVVILVFAASRSAIVQLFVLMPLLVIKLKRHMLMNKFIKGTLIIIILFLIVLKTAGDGLETFFVLAKNSHVAGRMQTLLLNNRRTVNEFSWSLANQYPLLGVGMGNYEKYSEREGLIHKSSGRPAYHHNVIAGTAAENGYLGLALFLFWYFCLLSTKRPSGKRCPYILTLSICAMIGGITHGLFLCFQAAIPFMMAILMESSESQESIL